MKPTADENRRIYTLYQRGTDRMLQERGQKLHELSTVSAGKVLDIGALDSTLLDLFSGFERFAVDLVSRQLPKEIKFCVADISQGVPFSDCQFDVVVAGELIEHLLDTEQLVAEIYRVLRPGGELVLSTPNMAYWRNLIQIAMNQNPFWVDWKNGQEGHVRYFSPKTIQELLEHAGFEEVRISTIQDVAKGNNPILRLFGTLVQLLSANHNMLLIARGRKRNKSSVIGGHQSSVRRSSVRRSSVIGHQSSVISHRT